MESTVSVSKGVFLFQNGYKKTKNNKNKASSGLLEGLFQDELWFTVYKRNWNLIENELKGLHYRTYSVLLNDIVSHIKEFYTSTEEFSSDGIIPSATLLTGVSQPDHVSQFTSLVDIIKDEVTPHVAIVGSQDAPTVKHLVENAVWQLISKQASLDTTDNDDLNFGIKVKTKLKKNQCTMRTLKKWYHSKFLNGSPKKNKHQQTPKPLVVIMPDFESFNCNVLQDFVMIVSSYTSCLPIVFIFGVATSVSALHKSFPYHVSSKLLIKVFHSHSSPVYMNKVLDEIFLTHTSPFHMSGKALELLTDVFLFYDFSVTGLIQSIKYCMMDHYYGDNMKSLCCPPEMLEEVILKLSAKDLEAIRQLMSFRPFLEKQDCRAKISLFEDDNYFRDALYREINRLYEYLYSFYLCVRLLYAFVQDIPKNLLGKSVREIYTKCAVECIVETEAFKECMQLVNFQSQVKLVESVKNAIKTVNNYLQAASPVKPLQSTPRKNNVDNNISNDQLGEPFVKNIRVHLLMFLRQIEKANTEATVVVNNSTQDIDFGDNVPGNRYKLKENLLKAARIDKVQSEFEMVRVRLISYLEEVFVKGLQPPQSRPFHEVLLFGEVGGVKKQLVGAPRGALHLALHNPAHYLQCECCQLQCSESVVDTLPDISLAYKLHRECGKHINLYDWLQAFAAVLEPDVDHEDRLQHTAIQ